MEKKKKAIEPAPQQKTEKREKKPTNVKTLKQTKADEKERKTALQERLFSFTLIDHLIDDERESSLAARNMILNCHPSVSCLLLGAISIIFYYCKYDKRINLNGKFKGISVLEKIQVSIRNYLSNFNLEETEEDAIVHDIVQLLVTSWTEI